MFKRMVCGMLLMLGFSLGVALAQKTPLLNEAVNVTKDADSIQLERNFTILDASERILLPTPPGADGISRRLEVRSKSGTPVNWGVITLANNSEEQIDRLIVAPHYRMISSGLIAPDLGGRRITAITPSQGFPPERLTAIDQDVFQITLDPGTSVTLVMELARPKVTQLTLWKPDIYKDRENSFTLYKGIIIGIATLLALFLTTLFVVKGSVMFPAAALLAWAVLGYVGLDFGFWSKMLSLSPEKVGLYRAAGESILAATLAVFLFAYLNLNRWHVRYSHLTLAWLSLMITLAGIAFFINPAVAASISRFSLGLIALVGLGVVIYMASHHYDRAIMVLPTWFLIVIWVFAVGLIFSGRVRNDFAAPAALGALVLLVMLIGFTVIQHAFAGGALAHGLLSDSERKSLALVGSGDFIWDWDINTDFIYLSPELETLLGARAGSLSGSAANFLGLVRNDDRDKVRIGLDTLLDQRRGRLHIEFKLRAGENEAVWVLLRARPILGIEGEVIRVSGTLHDITEDKVVQERLVSDAIFDNLTGLPNRTLFLDRLRTALIHSKATNQDRPTVIVLNVDNFNKINEAIGRSAGDTLLLTLSRRFSRMLKPIDSLARIGGDEFAFIILSERDPQQVTAFTDLLRRAIRAPITYGEREIFLTASIGLALIDTNLPSAEDVLRDAEFAAFHAKKIGGDRIQVFKPAMRAQRSDRLIAEDDLRQALHNQDIKLLYRPVVRLTDRTLAGFEIVPRWDHPIFGRLPVNEFLALAEETGQIIELGLYMLEHGAAQLNYWQKEVPTNPPLFLHCFFSSLRLLRQDIVQDVENILIRNPVAPNSLILELSEPVIMENPELMAQIIMRFKALQLGIMMTDYGTGYSSLTYMQRLTLDRIKLHPSLIRISSGGERSPVLRSVIALANDLNLKIVGESLEREEDVLELSQLGCDFAQGQAFGEPLTAQEGNSFLMDGE